MEQALVHASPLLPNEAMEWAAAQLRLQVLNHIRSFSGLPQDAFMRNACGTIKALEGMAEQSRYDPETAPVEGP